METTKEKSITKSSIYYLIYSVINVLFPFLTGVYVARIIMPDALGTVEAARNLTQYFVIMSFLGIPTYGLREISKLKNRREERSKVFSELMVINAISTTICLVSYVALVFTVPGYRSDYRVFLITGILIFLNYFNNGWLFMGLEEFGLISIRNVIFKVLSFVFLVCFVKSSNDYLIYAAITVCGTAGNYLWNMVCTHKFADFSLKELDLRRHLKSIFALVMVNIAIEIYSLVDITMINLTCGKENVTYYSYASKIEKILITVINSFTIVIVPRITYYFKEKKINEFNKLISKTLTIIIIFAVPAIIGLWFVSDTLLVSIYGDIYIASSKVLKILMFGILISPIGYLLGSRVMLATGNEKKMIIPVALGAIINIICNAFMIKMWQESGAAIASIISELVVAIVYIWLSKKYFKIEGVLPSIIKVAVSSTIMAIYLYAVTFIKIEPIYISLIQISGASLIYFVTLLLTKETICIEFLNKLKRKKIHNEQ